MGQYVDSTLGLLFCRDRFLFLHETTGIDLYSIDIGTTITYIAFHPIYLGRGMNCKEYNK